MTNKTPFILSWNTFFVTYKKHFLFVWSLLPLSFISFISFRCLCVDSALPLFLFQPLLVYYLRLRCAFIRRGFVIVAVGVSTVALWTSPTNGLFVHLPDDLLSATDRREKRRISRKNNPSLSFILSITNPTRAWISAIKIRRLNA